MKRILQFVARLYPERWRRRYGNEFDALLADVNADLRAVWDVLVGAMKMQVATWNFAWILAACGVAGAISGGALSFTVPVRYVSSADFQWHPETADHALVPQIRELVKKTFSTESLAGLVRRQHLDRQGRGKEPMEQVISKVRQDIRIVAGRRGAFQVSFAGRDAEQARRVTSDISIMLVEGWLAARETTADFSTRTGGAALQLLDEPSMPLRAASPNRAAFAALGLGAGLLAGAAAHQLQRRATRRAA
jgi:hypothetical protein